MKKQKKVYKAYILSTSEGTVQIGRTVYHIPTQKRFRAPMKGCRNYPSVQVDNNNFEAARKALQLFGSIEKSRNLTIRV